MDHSLRKTLAAVNSLGLRCEKLQDVNRKGAKDAKDSIYFFLRALYAFAVHVFFRIAGRGY